MPATIATSKQLLPVFDKPLVYYPLTTLILAGIEEVLIVTSADHISAFRKLFGNGSNFGISIEYAIQDEPRGIVDALLTGRDFVQNHPVALILGDNIFHGEGLGRDLEKISAQENVMFAVRVSDPKPYGVVDFDVNGNAISIVEKPENPTSNWVVPGLYFYKENVMKIAETVQVSDRGELEITDLNRALLSREDLTVKKLSRGTSWFDTGTPSSMLAASLYVQSVQDNQGMLIGSPEEASWVRGLISDEFLLSRAENYKSAYGSKLRDVQLGGTK